MKGVPYHVPVLPDEVLTFLLSDPTLVYVDATVGGGGHAAGICRRLKGEGRLICVDADDEALKEAKKALAGCERRASFFHANFRDLKAVLQSSGLGAVGGVLMDLGVSSHQLDEGERGFSFRSDAPLDMRMDRRQEVSALTILNGESEESLAALLWEFGEERHAKRIARRIVAARPLSTTGDLLSAVQEAVGGKFLTKSLARVFQAVRIAVNDELGSLRRGLESCLEVLRPGGRMVVISYHSLEDRVVKEFMVRESADRIRSAHKYLPDLARSPRLKILTRKPLQPGETETRNNPRARSAKLRAAERLQEA